MSSEDILDVWQQVLSGKNIVLCGVTTSSQGKKKQGADSSDDEVGITGKKKKEESDEDREQKVEKLVQNLKAKQGIPCTLCTPVQLQVRGEMLAVGVHTSDNDPLPVFAHCGSMSNKHKST